MNLLDAAAGKVHLGADVGEGHAYSIMVIDTIVKGYDFGFPGVYGLQDCRQGGNRFRTNVVQQYTKDGGTEETGGYGIYFRGIVQLKTPKSISFSWGLV